MKILKNGTFIDWQSLKFSQKDILIREREDPEFHSGPAEFNPQEIEVIDCTGKFITRSFANAHHHAYSALALGMPAPPETPENFLEILKNIWWRLDRSLDHEMIRASAMVTAIACAKNGVTFVIDHHSSPFAVEGSLDIIAEAFDQVGIGHLLCYEISDRDGFDIAKKGLEETTRYLSKRQGLVGLHASFTVCEKTLREAVALAKKLNAGIHVHVAEDKSDEDHCIRTYQTRVIGRFGEAGVLQFPKTILGHCIHLDDQERELVRESPAWIVQNPESNLNNKVGHFNSTGLGKNILVGTDGMHSDLLRSATTAFFSGQNYDTIDYPEIYRRLRNIHHYIHTNGFAGDDENNFVVLDYDSPTPFTEENFLGHFIFGIESRHILHVVSNGKLIVKDRMILTVDEAVIMEESKQQANKLWERMARS